MYIFLSKLLLFVICAVQNEAAPSCYRKASQDGRCLSCSWDRYNSINRVYTESEEFDASNCVEKTASTESVREVMVTNTNCSGPCSAAFHFVYDDFATALRQETIEAAPYLSSSVKIYIHGAGPHYSSITEGEAFFQRVRAKIHISPLFCEKLSVAGCVQTNGKSYIRVTSLKWQLYVHTHLSIEGIVFDFLGSNLAKGAQEVCGKRECCSEEQLGLMKSEANPCGLLRREVFAPESLLLGRKALLVIEKMFDEPGAQTPSLRINDSQFLNIYTVDPEKEAVSLIKIKQQGTSLNIQNVALSKAFLLRGAITFEAASYGVPDIDSYPIFTANLAGSPGDSINISGLLITSYNNFFLQNTGDGGQAIVDLSLWKGSFGAQQTTISNFTANHKKHLFLKFSTLGSCSLSFLFIRGTVDLGVLGCEDSPIKIQFLYISNFLNSEQSAFRILRSEVNITRFAVSDVWGSLDGTPFLFGDSSVVLVSEGSFERGTNLSFTFSKGQARMQSLVFHNMSFDYAFVAGDHCQLTVSDSRFENISGNFWVFEATGEDFLISNCSGVRFFSEAAFNFENCKTQTLLGCEFVLMSGLASFFSPSRLFFFHAVKNTTISDSGFSVFYSFYTESDNDPAILFENVVLQNLLISDILLEFCCTNFTFSNSLAKDIYLHGESGRCIGAFEVEKHYSIINSEFYNVGWLNYPEGGLDLTLILYRCIFSLWFANSFTMRATSFRADVDISAPTGIVAAPNFDEGLYFSDLLVDLPRRNSKNCVKVFLFCYAAEILFENATIRNAGCPDSSKELTFFHNHGALGFFNFPQYGGEKANTKHVKLANIAFENCFCVSGGTLFLVNYNYVSISNCTFLSSLAEDNGGHLMIVSANEVNITSCRFKNSSATVGGALFFLYIGRLELLLSQIFQSNATNNAGGVYMDTVESAVLAHSRFSELHAFNRGGGFYLDQTLAFMKNITVAGSESQNGGVFYVSFGSEIQATSLEFQGAKAFIGGGFFIEESKNFELSNAVFTDCRSFWLSSVLHLKSFENLRIVNISIDNVSSASKSALYVRTFDTGAVAQLENVKCLRSQATLGAFLLYEGACNLFLRHILVAEVIASSIFEFNQPSNVKVEALNITVENSSADVLWGGRSLAIQLTDFIFRQLQLKQAGFALDSSKLQLKLGLFIDVCRTDPKDSDAEPYLLQGMNLEINASDLKFNQRTADSDSIILPFLQSKSLSSLTLQGILLTNYFKSPLPWIQTIMGNITIANCNFTSYDQTLLAVFDCESVNIFNFTSLRSSCEKDVIVESLVGFAGLVRSSFRLSNVLIRSKSLGVFLSMNLIDTINLISIIYEGDIDLTAYSTSKKELAFAKINFFTLLNVSASRFQNLFAQEGACLSIESEQRSRNSLLVISNSSFKNIWGLTGSVIFSLGSFSLFLKENTFSYCKASLLASSALSGIGAVAYISRSEEVARVLLENNTFNNNEALRFAPTLFIEAFLSSNKRNLFTNNVDAGGFTSELSSYPVVFLAAFNDTSKLTEAADFKNLSSERFLFASGQAFNLIVQMFDSLGNRLCYDNVSRAAIEVDISGEEGSGEVIIKKNSAKASMGKFTFNNLLIKAAPNKNLSILLSVTLIEERCCNIEADALGSALFLTQRILVYSRPCALGEIKTVDNICFPCPQGTYSIIDPMAETLNNGTGVQKCYQCPENARCERDMIVPNAGYWKASKYSTLILRCEIPEACLGGPSSILNITDEEIIKGQCIQGHFGNLCNDCDSGYGKFNDGGLCQNCNKESTTIIIKGVVIAVCVILYIAISSKIFARTADPSRGVSFPSLLFKLLLSHFHQVSVVTFMEKLTVIPSLEFFINTQKLFSFLSQDFISMDCMVNNSEGDRKIFYVYKVMATLVLPIALGVVSSLFWIILFISMVLLSSESRLKNSETVKRILIGFAISIYVFYPLIIQSCFSLLNCIALDDRNTQEYLFIAPNMDCWDNRHVFYILTVFVPGVIVIGIVFPIFMYASLRIRNFYLMPKISPQISAVSPSSKASDLQSSPRSTSTLAASRTRIRKSRGFEQEPGPGASFTSRLKYLYLNLLMQDIFRFFHEGYKDEFFFWELTIFARKFVLTMVASLNQLLRPQTKNILILITLFINLSYSLDCKAFRDPRANRLEQISLLSTVITCMCMVFIANLESLTWKTFFGVITIAINSAFIATVALFIIHHLRYKFLSRQGAKPPRISGL